MTGSRLASGTQPLCSFEATISSLEQRASTIGASRYIHKVHSYDEFVSGVGQAVEAMLAERQLKTPPHEATISGTTGSGGISQGNDTR